MTAHPSPADLDEMDRLAESLGITDEPVARMTPLAAPPRGTKEALVESLEESLGIANALIGTVGRQNVDLAASVARNSEQITALSAKIDALLALHNLSNGGDNG